MAAANPEVSRLIARVAIHTLSRSFKYFFIAMFSSFKLFCKGMQIKDTKAHSAAKNDVFTLSYLQPFVCLQAQSPARVAFDKVDNHFDNFFVHRPFGL